MSTPTQEALNRLTDDQAARLREILDILIPLGERQLELVSQATALQIEEIKIGETIAELYSELRGLGLDIGSTS